MNRTMTCISCPVGCKLEIEAENGKISSISGNKCKRGIVYAENEFYHPKRILTTTIYVDEVGKMLPVRSDNPLPKEKILEYVNSVKGIRAKPPIKAGDILKKDIEVGVNIIASSDL